MKITTVIPTRGLLFARTVASLTKNGVQSFILIEGLGIPDAQNTAVSEALKTNCEAIFFYEDDMEIADGTLKAMVGLMEAGNPVVVVDYRIDGGGLISQLVGNTNGKPSAAGLGCTLVKRSVFEEMEQPWFRTDISMDFKTKKILDTPSKYGGQDLYFFYYLREKMGITPAMLPDYEANHLRCRELNRIQTNNGAYHIAAIR